MKLDVEDRFWSKVDKSGRCWQWTAGCSPDGYGKFKVAGRSLKAHRFAFESVKGPIPKGLVLDHLCRNRGCVNPEHLEPVTFRENMMRGVGYTAAQARKTHCKHRHEFTPENTYYWRTSRICRTCRSALKVG